MRVITKKLIAVAQVEDLLNVKDYCNLYDNLKDFVYALWAEDQLTDHGYDEIKYAIDTCFKNNKMLKGYKEFKKQKRQLERQKNKQRAEEASKRNLPIYEQYLKDTEQQFNEFWSNLETNPNLVEWQEKLDNLPNLIHVKNAWGISEDHASFKLYNIDGRNTITIWFLPKNHDVNRSKEYSEHYISIMDKATSAWVQYHIQAKDNIIDILKFCKKNLYRVKSKSINYINSGIRLKL